jgi:hypothetical protein
LSLQSQKEKVVELETAIGQKEKELAEQIQLFQSKQAALEETEVGKERIGENAYIRFLFLID